LPAKWCPRAARVRIGNSARGDRSRSTLQACLPERRPSIERDSLYVADLGTNVNRLVTPYWRTQPKSRTAGPFVLTPNGTELAFHECWRGVGILDTPRPNAMEAPPCGSICGNGAW
jgi:hypothetical protein